MDIEAAITELERRHTDLVAVLQGADGSMSGTAYLTRLGRERGLREALELLKGATNTRIIESGWNEDGTVYTEIARVPEADLCLLFEKEPAND